MVGFGSIARTTSFEVEALAAGVPIVKDLIGNINTLNLVLVPNLWKLAQLSLDLAQHFDNLALSKATIDDVDTAFNLGVRYQYLDIGGNVSVHVRSMRHSAEWLEDRLVNVTTAKSAKKFLRHMNDDIDGWIRNFEQDYQAYSLLIEKVRQLANQVKLAKQQLETSSFGGIKQAIQACWAVFLLWEGPVAAAVVAAPGLIDHIAAEVKKISVVYLQQDIARF